MKRFLLVIGLLAATLTIVSTSSATVRALITGKDVKDGSLSSADIANGSLQAKDLAPAVLARMSSNVPPARRVRRADRADGRDRCRGLEGRHRFEG